MPDYYHHRYGAGVPCIDTLTLTSGEFSSPVHETSYLQTDAGYTQPMALGQTAKIYANKEAVDRRLVGDAS